MIKESMKWEKACNSEEYKIRVGRTLGALLARLNEGGCPTSFVNELLDSLKKAYAIIAEQQGSDEIDFEVLERKVMEVLDD